MCRGTQRAYGHKRSSDTRQLMMMTLEAFSRSNKTNTNLILDFSSLETHVDSLEHIRSVTRRSTIAIYLRGEPPSPDPFPDVHPEVLPVPGASPIGRLTGVVGPDSDCPAPGMVSPKIGGVSVLSIRWPSFFAAGGL